MAVLSLKTLLKANWLDRSTLPLAVLGVAYLFIYSAQVLNVGGLILETGLEIVSWGIWGIFTVDLIARLICADSFLGFFKSNWLEILAVGIPFLRVLRIFRIIVALRGLKPFFKNRITATGIYILLALPMVWFVGAIGVLDAESSVDSPSIANLPDALWWSLVTITTVGYGDLSPKSVEGKFVAAILMVSGIALFSAGAGIFASWIMNGKTEDKD